MTRNAENESGASGQVAAVLDIGPGVGALVVYTSARHAGAEIDVTSAAPGGSGTHSVVHPRPAPGRSEMHAAVFPELIPGVYWLSMAGLGVCGAAVIDEGCVTEATLHLSLQSR